MKWVTIKVLDILVCCEVRCEPKRHLVAFGKNGCPFETVRVTGQLEDSLQNTSVMGTFTEKFRQPWVNEEVEGLFRDFENIVLM